MTIARIDHWPMYAKLALRTESIPINTFEKVGSNQQIVQDNSTRLLHAALGLCTEIEEFKVGTTKVNFVEEIGDVFWYLAIIDDIIIFSRSMPPHEALAATPYSVGYYVGEIQDVMKRHLFYGTVIDRERIIMACHCICWHLEDELIKGGHNLADAWTANIIKLEKRYPEKFFDAKAAIHRDVDRELEHISETGEVMIVGATPAMVGEVEVKPYTLELGESEDAQLASEVKKRQSQFTIPTDIDELLDQATVESDILLRWDHLTTLGIELDNLTPEEMDDLFTRPHAVKAKVLAWLGCSAEKAAAIMGEQFTHSESRVHCVGDGIFHLKVVPYEPVVSEDLSPEIIMETFFPINQVILSFQGFNDTVRSLLTLGQIEKMAMDLAFVRAEQYRKMGALELARGYDVMYKSYSGKGDRLEDYSLAIMWQEAGYSLDEQQVKERLERWK